MTNSITVTIPNPTPAQIAALIAALNQGTLMAMPTNIGTITDAPLAGLTAKRAPKKAKPPAPTVSPDEDEDFGAAEIGEDDLDITAEDEEEEEEEDQSLDFRKVKEAINKYGEKNPAGMKTIYAAFNIKNTKELETKKNKWAPVYEKVMAKLNVKKSRN